MREKTDMSLLLYYGEGLAHYAFGNGHPFGPDRLDAFWQETVKRGFDKRARICQPVLATEASLHLFHTDDYIDRVKTQSETGEGFLDCGDTPAFKGVFEAGRYVVGTVLDGMARLFKQDAKRVFVPIAGLHHARRNSAAGFCAFNDIGVLIEALKAEQQLTRIAYVDIDAHHGDGVFYAFEDDPTVFFADIHEDGRYLYPGTGRADETGRGPAKGRKLNLPMPPGADDAAFHRAWPEVEDFVQAARPEIIILQAGADSIDGDPITDMRYTPAVHAHAAQQLRRLADDNCGGRLIALGGGGYNRHNLAQAWNAVVEALL